MERKNFAVLCAAVLCFWLFALALGTAEGVGLRAVMHPEERAVSADVEEAAEGILLPAAAAAPQLDLNCRAAILIEQGSGRVLYEKNADERVPIASITKVMTCLLTLEAVDRGEDYCGPGFTEVYFYHQRNILPFMERFPLEKLHLFGQEGILAPNYREILSRSPEEFQAWLTVARRYLEVPELLSYSEHAMYIGRKLP